MLLAMQGRGHKGICSSYIEPAWMAGVSMGQEGLPMTKPAYFFRLFASITVVVFAALMSVASSGGENENECTEENHCVRDGDQVNCEEGYTWEDPDDSDNFKCLPQGGIVQTDLNQAENCIEGSEGCPCGPYAICDPGLQCTSNSQVSCCGEGYGGYGCGLGDSCCW
jgi:hypothetical protein